VSSGGRYYKSHLPRLGSSQETTEDATQPGCSSKGHAYTWTGDQGSESTRSVYVTGDTGTRASELREPATSDSSDSVYVKASFQKVGRIQDSFVVVGVVVIVVVIVVVVVVVVPAAVVVICLVLNSN